MNAIVIATRESRLALRQAARVRALPGQRLGLAAALPGMATRGGQVVGRMPSRIGGQDLSMAAGGDAYLPVGSP